MCDDINTEASCEDCANRIAARGLVSGYACTYLIYENGEAYTFGAGECPCGGDAWEEAL